MWQRQRTALRTEITDAAVRLFIAHGFERTTIDEIADAVGVSRRTVFRYFGSKEDLILGDLAHRGEAIAAALERRPVSEDAWTALLSAMGEARGIGADPATDLALARMMRDTPSLRARHLEKRLRWQELLVPLLTARITAPHAALAAAAIVTTALGCLDVATDALLRSDEGTRFDDLYVAALAAVRGGRAV